MPCFFFLLPRCFPRFSRPLSLSLSLSSILSLSLHSLSSHLPRKLLPAVLGLIPRPEGRVPLLPEELARADEGGGVLELPPDDVGPLVEPEGQVAPRADPVGKVGVPERERRERGGRGRERER